MTDLPPDILDKICSLLDANALRACIAAPSLFTSVAERHLYSAIDLSPRGTINEGSSVTLNRRQLYNLLKEKPHVSVHIRIRLVIKSEDAVAWFSGSDTKDNYDVPELPCLRALSLETGEAIGENGLRWTSLPQALRLYWEGLVRIPSIEAVAVQDIYDFPLRILDLATSAKQLRLNGGSHTFKISSATTTSVIQSASLTLHRDQIKTIECFKWFYHAPKEISRLSGLHTLHFRSNMRTEFAILSRLFQSCSGTLQELTVDIAEPANMILYQWKEYTSK
ncbi:hypothetical protein CPB83DRAFT_303153 [Crepidotus variabilis]|uniref:F-box domain-containing protein n=1 Tax=Crepidotus variabilis TaxID=179855 RepID=A0A9P6JPV9_9AGAR|nr:hypothetical protein CPB83DRAFT_303153 [Crepidotus variabilis]